MKKIILAYANDMTALASVGSSQKITVHAVVFEDKVEVERITGKTLRQVEYAHRISVRDKWNIIISTNAINETHRAFFKAFWSSFRQGISLDNGSTFIEVVIPGGDIPEAFVESSINMPEYTLALRKKVAS